MAISEISVSKIYILATEPTNKIKDRFWFDTTNNLLKRYDGTSWKPISVSSDDVVVLSDGNKISLTSYLNTQIAALAEGIDTKQDKLKFYSEVDKSDDTSSTAEASKLTLKTAASQYGGSEINLIASNGEYNPGNINLKAKSWNTSNGGNITLESEGGSASGGNITLHSKVNTGGSATPGGLIKFIADGDSNTGTKSNISLQANTIKLSGNDGGLQSNINLENGTIAFSAVNAIALNSDLTGSGISTYIKGTNPNNESPTLTVSDSKVPSEKAVYNALETKQKKLSTYSETVPTDKSYPEEVIITAKGQDLLASNGAGTITLSATDSSDSRDDFAAGTINLNATKVQKNGVDIATTTDLATKQNTLQFYIESGEGVTSTAKITAYNFEVASAQIKLDSEYGIDGNILEKTISETSSDTKIPTAKAVYTAVNAKANKSTTLSGYGITNAYTKTEVDTELGKKQDALHCYSETASGEAIISNATSFSVNGTSDGLIVENNTGGIAIQNNSFEAGKGAISLSNNFWNDGSAILFDYEGQGVAVSDALLIPEIKNKQNSSDSDLTTNEKTIVGAINEINSLVIGNTLPTPITDAKTITTTLENLITDTQYANKPGTILINPAITNVGVILVGENITDLNKAFPIYTDQPVTIAFKNINDFKVAGNIAGDKFNYIISFGYINTNIVSDNLKITTTNGVYEITPEGDAESMTLKISKIS